MAREASVTAQLIINKSPSLRYQNPSPNFQADVTGNKGPTPGAFDASTSGTIVDLSELTTPGLARIVNLDATNTVVIGICETSTTKFYPMLDLLPGEHFIVRLSQFLSYGYGLTPGTGTSDSGNTLMIKALVASANVSVEAFEK